MEEMQEMILDGKNGMEWRIRYKVQFNSVGHEKPE